MMQAIKAAIASIVVRGKVVQARVSGRTLVQASVLDEDTHDLVELALPPGYVAVPIAGADVIELQISGLASHKVLIGGDHTADAVANLAAGECGLSRGGQLILLRIGRTEMVSPLLQWGTSEAALKRLVTEQFLALFNGHTHTDPQGGNTSPPTQQMNVSHLTGGS